MILMDNLSRLNAVQQYTLEVSFHSYFQFPEHWLMCPAVMLMCTFCMSCGELDRGFSCFVLHAACAAFLGINHTIKVTLRAIMLILLCVKSLPCSPHGFLRNAEVAGLEL